jgi:hypothetical protein
MLCLLDHLVYAEDRFDAGIVSQPDLLKTGVRDRSRSTHERCHSFEG